MKNVINQNNDKYKLINYLKKEDKILISHVEKLINSGVDVNLKDFNNFGATALMYACEKGNFEVVDLLIKKNVKINLTDNLKYTALMCAAEFGHIKIVELLFKNAADLNLRDKIGDTAVALAFKHSHMNVVEFLLDNGALILNQNLWAKPLMDFDEERKKQKKNQKKENTVENLINNVEHKFETAMEFVSNIGADVPKLATEIARKR